MLFDFDEIRENFKVGYRAMGSIYPKSPRCNLGAFMPCTASEDFYNHDLFVTTLRVLDNMDYIKRRYFVIMTVARVVHTRDGHKLLSTNEVLAKIAREHPQKVSLGYVQSVIHGERAFRAEFVARVNHA